MSLSATDTQSEFVTISEFSLQTGIAPATLRYWRGENVGPASFKLGGRIVYRRGEVDRWLSQQETATRRGGDAA